MGINAFGFTKIGSIAAATGGGNWSAGVALQGDDFNNPESTNTSETVGLEGRVTWAPIYDRTPDGVTVVHLGLNARVELGRALRDETDEPVWRAENLVREAYMRRRIREVLDDASDPAQTPSAPAAPRRASMRAVSFRQSSSPTWVRRSSSRLETSECFCARPA